MRMNSLRFLTLMLMMHVAEAMMAETDYFVKARQEATTFLIPLFKQQRRTNNSIN